MKKLIFLLSIFSMTILVAATAAAQDRFVAHLNGIQEVPANNSTGGGNCTIVLNAAETQMTVNCTFSGLVSAANAGHIHDNGPVGVNGPVRFNFGTVTGTSGTLGPLNFAVTPAQVADMRAKRHYANIHSATFPGGEIRGQVKPAETVFDFDGDGRTDLKTRRSSNATFYTSLSINNSLVANVFGNTTEGTLNNAADDYDGDGRGDLVIFNITNGSVIWRILQTSNNTIREVNWGNNTVATFNDQLLPADYDGDGRTDIAVFRRSTGVWYIIQSSNGQQRAERWGQLNDFGMVGDFDKDGISDFTAVRGTTEGIGWFTRRSSGGSQGVFWGGGVPQPATSFIFPAVQIDVDGDGIQDHMVQRDPDSGFPGDEVTYFVRRSSDGVMLSRQWGLDTDGRILGDYDGDGRTDFAARRTIGSQLVWFILLSSNNYNTTQQRTITFGNMGDVLFEEPESDLGMFEISSE